MAWQVATLAAAVVGYPAALAIGLAWWLGRFSQPPLPGAALQLVGSPPSAWPQWRWPWAGAEQLLALGSPLLQAALAHEDADVREAAFVRMMPEQQAQALHSYRGEYDQRWTTRFQQADGLPAYDAAMVTQSLAMAAYYEAARNACQQPKLVANWLMGEVSKRLNTQGIDINASPVSPAQLAALVVVGKVLLLVAGVDAAHVGQDPDLQEVRGGVGRVIELAVTHAGASTHALHVAGADDAVGADAVLVRQRAVEHVADDLHVAVAVRAEAGAGRDAVFVDDAQVAPAHPGRVVVARKREGMVALEPAVVGITTVLGAADLHHGGVSVNRPVDDRHGQHCGPRPALGPRGPGGGRPPGR